MRIDSLSMFFALALPAFAASIPLSASQESHALGTLQEAALPERIVWYTDWGQALEQAGRSGRPLFLMSGAPRCHDVPGLW